ncbi:MAG: tetratricopeptide repeat protein [Chitinispirillaceae bacterium]|nr:tetratricopeptide repeat protein [Chitinispirillaceae bacterium]
MKRTGTLYRHLPRWLPVVVLWAVIHGALVCCGCVSAPSHTASTLKDQQDQRAATADSTAVARKAVADSAVAHKLSPASQLLIKACDNYIAVNPNNPKIMDVLTIKASLYYNNRQFEKSRSTYLHLLEQYPNTPTSVDAVKMIAQGYYEEKNFDSAQVWYRKLSTMDVEGVNKGEAVERIAESIFRSAEQLEEQKRFKEAASQYKRLAMEFPKAVIADVAMFNASHCYEKQAEWSHVILTLQQLLQKYPESKLVPKAIFRIGISNAKLLKWDLAAESYLRMVARYPRSELAPTAMYNAGFAFENADKLPEAAATFEKMVQLFPDSEDAADILFRAGELYGKMKNWEAVSRVNQLFSNRFGNDAARAIQARCMVGIALYMQNKEDEALEELGNAVSSFARMKNPSAVNAYYAAKAQFTIGEISHATMQAIALALPKKTYKKSLRKKSDLLDETVKAYSLVLKFNISEWTTRAVCQIGQAYEDFAVGVFKQQREPDLSLAERLALELGIAQAVEKYFIQKALKYHEQNVKIGIKEKLEDKNILISRQKLTYLPYAAGENYIALAKIARDAESKQKLDGFALIGRKLELLQKIAPFQERATDLFLQCLEIGTTYQERNDFYAKASSSITSISFTVAQTYADVVTIAIEAPIPAKLDSYERFVYKTKLLKQVEGYQEQALTSYLKTLKIAEAYAIEDESVSLARERLAALLFTLGRCKDLLCVESFAKPPLPKDASEAEAEEYKARFEEIGLRFQEQAFDIYKSILKFAVQKYASGPFVTHAYVRLFQNFPEEYGLPEDKTRDTVFSSQQYWKCSTDSFPNWFAPDFNDSAWRNVRSADAPPPKGFPTGPPEPIIYDGSLPAEAPSLRTFYFRRTLSLASMPRAATLHLHSTGALKVMLNGVALAPEAKTSPSPITTYNMFDAIRSGKNVLGIKLSPSGSSQGVLFPLISVTLASQVFVAKPPGGEKVLLPEEIRADVYEFPFIKNFSQETGVVQK